MREDLHIEMVRALERTASGLEGLVQDVAEIKQSMIPDGSRRIKELEVHVDSLNTFKYFMTTVGGILLALLPFSTKIIEYFHKGNS